MTKFQLIQSYTLNFQQINAAAAKSLQSCLTLCDPIDGSPSGSIIPGILQARTLEWVAISFSNACKRKVKVKLLSRVRLLATPWTAAHQAPPSMGFYRQEYWSGGAIAFSLLWPKIQKSWFLILSLTIPITNDTYNIARLTPLHTDHLDYIRPSTIL